MAVACEDYARSVGIEHLGLHELVHFLHLPAENRRKCFLMRAQRLAGLPFQSVKGLMYRNVEEPVEARFGIGVEVDAVFAARID